MQIENDYVLPTSALCYSVGLEQTEEVICEVNRMITHSLRDVSKDNPKIRDLEVQMTHRDEQVKWKLDFTYLPLDEELMFNPNLKPKMRLTTDLATLDICPEFSVSSLTLYRLNEIRFPSRNLNQLIENL